MKTIYHVYSSEGELTTDSLSNALKEAKYLLKRDIRVTLFTTTIESAPKFTDKYINSILENFVVRGLAH